MEIVWKNNKIKKQVVKLAQCNPTTRKRMSQLKNAPCYLDLPANCKAHFLHGDLANFFAIDFDYPTRLICSPIGEYKTENNQFIKQTITVIEIIKIEKDYH
ncbi:MAG: hypothetical protein HQ539_00455 [Parcubacteria group bacterium]|nr:hypothetical protein [Parcubacteria group bacterium]